MKRRAGEGTQIVADVEDERRSGDRSAAPLSHLLLLRSLSRQCLFSFFTLIHETLYSHFTFTLTNMHGWIDRWVGILTVQGTLNGPHAEDPSRNGFANVDHLLTLSEHAVRCVIRRAGEIWEFGWREIFLCNVASPPTTCVRIHTWKIGNGTGTQV